MMEETKLTHSLELCFGRVFPPAKKTNILVILFNISEKKNNNSLAFIFFFEREVL